MNSLYDIPLEKPLPDEWMHGLLFTFFTLHMVFVLLTIGTAILSVYYFLDSRWGGKTNELRLDKRIIRIFMAHKSLAIVLGIAPLLLIQVGHTAPFFTAVNLFAPFWILIIILLIIAFISFDILGHKINVHPDRHLIFGIIALGSLLIVPAIFVAVLITAENSDKWLSIITHGYKLHGTLAYHWLLRYLHVLGAALVFGAAFHYFFSTKDDTEKKSLLKWVVGGILLQIFLGIILYTSLPGKADTITNIFLFIGIIGAALLLWSIYLGMDRRSTLNIWTTIPLLMLILVPMLLTRQFIQDKSFIPFEKKLQANTQAYQKVVQPYKQEALDKYKSEINFIYDNGETIYRKSCAFCHGESMDGKGSESKNLAILPEDITHIRTTRQYLNTILTGGISGTAMPYFTVFDKYKLESLIDYLDKKHHVLSLTEPIPVKTSDSALQQSQKIYTETCTQCHGIDGKQTTLSKGFQPPPPDFSVYSLSPQRAFEIITNGYPGTVMYTFSDLPEEIRWGLVTIMNEKRTKE